MERLAELAEYDQAISGLMDEDFLAAGFTPDEIASYRGAASQPLTTPRAYDLSENIDTRRPNRFGDVAAKYGNEEIQSGIDLAFDPNVSLYGSLPASMQGGVMEPINREIMRVLDVPLGLLGAAWGLGQKGIALGAEAVASGTESEKRLARDLIGGTEVAGFGPEARMLAAISEAGGIGAAARTVAERANQPGPVPTMYSNPVGRAPVTFDDVERAMGQTGQDIELIRNVDRPDIIKDILRDDEYAADVLSSLRNPNVDFADAAPITDVQSVRSELYRQTQDRLADLPDEITVYRAGDLNEADGISSFTLNPNYNPELDLPWNELRGSPKLEAYTVKKSDILASPDLIRDFGEGEVIIRNNSVERAMAEAAPSIDDQIAELDAQVKALRQDFLDNPNDTAAFDEYKNAQRMRNDLKDQRAVSRAQGRDVMPSAEEPVRTATSDEGFEAYLDEVNPGGTRVAAEDRPNLMMGDMYGMLPSNSEVISAQDGVTFYRSQGGDYYATAFNPDVGEEDVVGYITNRGDSTELAVVGEMQGQGIGGELQYLFRKEQPDAPTGGLTEAGERSLQRTYERLRDEGIVDNASEAFDVTRSDASNIFGQGTERVRYTDPASGGTMEVVVRPDGSASVLELEVPEEFRGQGIGQSLQDKVMQDFPMMGGQVSSKAAATTAYRLGRRPPNNPDATLEDVFAEIDEMSSVNMISPEMQARMEPKQVEAPTDERRGIIAFHGSGADFDRFELSKIGTGERAQAFGRGLYFTDSEDIAEFYRQSVRQRQDMSLGREVSYRGNKVADLGDTAAGDVQSLENSAVNRIAENINKVTTMATKDLPQSELAQIAKDKSVSDLQKQLDGLGQVEDDPIMEMVAESLQDEIDALEAVDVSEFNMATGKKYQVNIDVSPEELLNWDLPLDQQTPAAQRAILKTVDEIDLDDAIDLGFDIFYGPYDGDEAGAINAAKDKLLNDFSAKNFLQNLSKIRGKGAGEELLAKNGLKGITYKADQGPTARDPSAGGPNNYVIFDDKLINIMKKYGIVGPVAVTGIAAQEETSNEI